MSSWWKNGQKFFFDYSVKYDIRTYENIRKIAIDQGDDYTTVYLLDYHYLKESSKLITMNLSRKQTIDADRKVAQQVSLTGNLEQSGSTAKYFSFEEVKETILDFSKGIVRVLSIYFDLV